MQAATYDEGVLVVIASGQRARTGVDCARQDLTAIHDDEPTLLLLSQLPQLCEALAES